MVNVIGSPSGSKDSVLAYAKANGAQRMDQVTKFVNELYAQNTFDPFMIACQAIHETDNFTSGYWVDHLNPAGLGITYDGEPSLTWESGTTAARAVLIHHAAYTGITLPASWQGWLQYDARYKLVKEAGFFGSVKTWDQYGNGKWAADPQYYTGIMSRVKDVQAFATNGGTHVSYQPTIIDKYLDVAQEGYDAVTKYIRNRSGMSPKIIVLHIQEGTNSGSWGYFHSVSASSTVLIGRNGEIWRIVEEQHGPWTNGDVQSPTALGWEVINTWGPDPNTYTLSIETEGYAEDDNPFGWKAWPKPQAQLDAVVWQIKDWMARYDIPLHYVLRHADINQITRPGCPGDTYYNYVIDAIRNDPPTTSSVAYAKAEPVMVNGHPWDGKANATVNGALFVADIKKVTTSKDADVHKFATTSSAFTRTALKTGEVFNVLGWVTGETVNGENRWWITKNFSRISVDATAEKPSVKATNDQPDLPEGVKLYKGVIYYPVSDERVQTVVKSANLRADATTKSAAVGAVKKGDKVTAAYWCVGDSVNGENLWWVLKPKGVTDPIRKGPRLWANATLARPD